MATDPATIDFLCDQMAGAGVSARKMFGEYAIYCDGKVVALVCDNQLFLKPTPGARALIAAPHEAPPYPGAKLHFRIEEELDDPDLLAQLVRTVASDLPASKSKPARKPKG